MRFISVPDVEACAASNDLRVECVYAHKKGVKKRTLGVAVGGLTVTNSGFFTRTTVEVLACVNEYARSCMAGWRSCADVSVGR